MSLYQTMPVCIISQEMKSLCKDYKYNVGCVMIFICMHVFRIDFFFLVTWQWAHLQFCSHYSFVLHVFNLLNILSLIMANALVLYMVLFHRFTRVAWGAFVPVDYATPRPGFQPWENRAWWWSQFKEPPCVMPFFVVGVSKLWL